MSRGTKDLKEVVVSSRINTDETDEETGRKISKLKALSDADKDLIAQLQASIQEKNKELENRNITIQAIQRNFENLSTICHSDRVELADLRKLREDNMKEIARLNGVILDLKSKMKDLESDLGSASAGADAYKKLRVQYEDLQDHAKKIEEAHNIGVKQRKELDAKVKTLQNDNNNLAREKQGLEQAISELQKALEEVSAECKGEVNKLVAECRGLEREKRELEQRIRSLEDANSRLESNQGSKEQEMRAERRRLEEKLANLEGECNRLREQLSAVVREGGESKKESRSKDETIAKLEDTISSLQAEVENASRRNSAIKRQLDAEFETERRKWQEEMDRLRNGLGNESLSLQQKIRDLEKKNQALASSKSEREHALERSVMNLENQLMSAQGEARAADARVESIRRELHTAETEKEALEAKLFALNSQSGDLSTALRDLQSALDNERSTSQSLQAAIEEERKRLESANQVIATLESDHKQYTESTQQALDESHKTIAELEGRLREMQDNLRENEGKDSELKRLRDDLEAEKKKAADDCEYLKHELSEAKREMAKLQVENDQLNMTLSRSMNADQENAKLRGEVKDLKGVKEECEKLRADLRKAERQCENVNNTNQALKDEMKGMQDKMRKMGEEMKDLEKRAKGFDPDEVSKELRATVSKLAHATEADEAALTCMQCMNIFNNPVTCNPCGHTFCNGCVPPLMEPCHECNSMVSHKINHENLEQMASKLVYKKQAMTALVDMCKV